MHRVLYILFVLLIFSCQKEDGLVIVEDGSPIKINIKLNISNLDMIVTKTDAQPIENSIENQPKKISPQLRGYHTLAARRQ